MRVLAFLVLAGGCTSRILLADPVTDPASDPGADTSIEVVGGETGAGETGAGETGETGHDTAVGYAHLPVLLIDTGGVSVTTLYKIDGTLDVVTEHDGTLTDLDSAPRAFTGPIGIEMHGTSSTGFPKLSFGLELRDDTGADLDSDLLGLGSDSDWVLVAAYGDKTYVRNPLAMDLGRALAEGTDRWEPPSQLVEVYYNGDYYGIYTLVGRIKRDGSRIDLPAPAADAGAGDVTGGYIVKLEYGRDPGWNTRRGTVMSWSDPQADQVTPAQSAYLEGYFDAFEAMLDGDGYASAYPAWIDTDAWIDHILVQELAHNVDGLRLSTYLYKGPDGDAGRLVAGPLWDFDRAFGNVNDCSCYQPAGWIQDDLTTCGYGYQFAPWWARLRAEPAFRDRMRCRWEALRGGTLSDSALDSRVADLLDEVREAEPRDQARWHTVGQNVGFNYYVGQTWQDEIDYLGSWLHQRTAWMDANLPGTCE